MSASLIDLGGEPHILNITRDITQRNRTEEELRKRKDELEKISRFAVDRELKMVELKKRVTELESERNGK